jgi:hypothetical protein
MWPGFAQWNVAFSVLVLQDVFISSLFTYVISHTLVMIRDRQGTENVASKTHIPSDFLV